MNALNIIVTLIVWLAVLAVLWWCAKQISGNLPGIVNQIIMVCFVLVTLGIVLHTVLGIGPIAVPMIRLF